MAYPLFFTVRLHMQCLAWVLAGCFLLLVLSLYPKVLAVQLLAWAFMALFLHKTLSPELGRRTSALLMLGFAYFLYWFYYFPDHTYTNDVHDHLAYVEYVSRYPFDIYGYSGRERWHPPFYYILAAGWARMANIYFSASLHSSLRIFSLLMYMTYCVYGLRTLLLFNRKEDLPYFLGCMLIVFWPLSILMATRINNDVMLYMLWAMFLYYYVRWHKESDIRFLRIIIMLAGIGFMIKTSAVAIAAMLACAMIYALCNSRLSWQQLFTVKMVPAYVMLGLGLVFNQARTLISYALNGQWTLQMGDSGNVQYPLAKLFAFNIKEYIARPYMKEFHVSRPPDQTVFFLKSLLYGEYNWRNESVAILLSTALLALFITIAHGLVLGARRKIFVKGDIYVNLTGIILPYLTLAGFFILKRLSLCSDARFVYPLVIPLAILCMLSIGAMQASKSRMYWPAIAAAFLVPSLGVLHYLAYYLL